MMSIVQRHMCQPIYESSLEPWNSLVCPMLWFLSWCRALQMLLGSECWFNYESHVNEQHNLGSALSQDLSKGGALDHVSEAEGATALAGEDRVWNQPILFQRRCSAAVQAILKKLVLLQ